MVYTFLGILLKSRSAVVNEKKIMQFKSTQGMWKGRGEEASSSRECRLYVKVCKTKYEKKKK